jgi:hypothetical protein
MIKKWIPLTLIPLLFGCGNSTSSHSTDMKDYFPLNIDTKSFLQTSNNGNNSDKKTYTEVILQNNNTLVYQVNNKITKTITIQNDDIIENNVEDKPYTKTMTRNIGIGSKLFKLTQNTKEKILFENTVLGTKTINSIKTCRLDSKIKKLDLYTIPYSGDILKFKCIEKKTIITDIKDNLPEYIDLKDKEVKSDYDISYFYMKRNIGLIVSIDNNCFINKSGTLVIDDSAKSCKKETYTRHFYLD